MVGIARFPEERIFRVDHYLSKEPVQGLLVLRFANLLFEPIWNRHHVNSVQITMTETYDVADRGSFYDTVGTIRDVIQNHLLQVMAYLAMEPSSSALAEAERNEKVKLLSAVRTADPADLIRGQYAGPDRPPRPLPHCGCSSTTGNGPTSHSSSAPANVCP
jgi:glucose-6-phosphate 1-dehydrogenase